MALSVTRREAGSALGPAGSAQRLVLLVFAAAVALILGAAHFSFKYFSGRVIQNAQENLLAIAMLKSVQIGMLIEAKMRDGRLFSGRRAVQLLLRGQASGASGIEIERLVAGFISAHREISRHRAILVVDAALRVVAPPTDVSIEPVERAALETVFKTRKPALADIHINSDGEADFGVAYPVFEDGDPEGRLLGAVFLESSLSETVFPVLGTWPTSSPSAASSLLRREGDEAIFLSPLRSNPAAPPLSIRIPMADERRLATRALMKGETLIEAYDSRGIEVVAAAYPVPGTPWVMVSKVDRDEVARPVQVLAATVAALTVVLLSLSAGISWLMLRWRSQSLALDRLELAERYATAARTSIDGYLVVDFHSGRITEANEALARMSGFGEGELLSRTIAEMDADESSRDIAERGRKLAKIGADRFGTRWKRKDGSVIDVEISMTYLPDSSGGRVHMFVRDVTERNRGEAALARESYRNQAFLRNSSDGVHILDAEGNALEVSDSFCRMLGYSRDELIGANVAKWDAQWSPKELRQQLKEHIEKGGPSEIETRHRRRDGSVIEVEVTANPLELSGNKVLFCSARDTTERKRAVEALRESEGRTRLLVDTAYDAFVAIDGAGVITDWNRQAEATFGWSRQEVLGRTVAETILPPRYRDAHRRGLKHFLETGEGPVLNRRIEITALDRRGHELPVELTIAPVRWGQTYLFSAFVRDITERKQRENEIAALNRLYRTLSATNEAIIRSKDRRDLCQRVCEIAANDGGWAAAWIGFVDERTKWIVPEAWTASMAPFIETMRVSVDAELPEGRGPTGISTRSGTPYYCNDVFSDPVTAPWREFLVDFGVASAAAVPIRPGRSFSGVLNLYSAQKNFFSPDVQALLAELCDDLAYAVETFDLKARQQTLEARLAGIVESSSDSISAADLNGVVTSWNAAAVALYGYSAEEMVGKRVEAIIPEDKRAAFAALLESVREGKSVSNIETVRCAKDGSRIDVALTLSPIKDAEGRVVAYSAIARNITESKRLEREIRDLNETLEQRVAERTRELENANRELDSFSYSISHDLRAPLRALVGFTGIIQQEYARALDEEGRQLLDRIVHNSLRMGEMIDDLLRLSRLGRAALELRAVDLNSLVSEVVRNELAEHPKTKVEVARLPAVTGDPGLLRQVFQNLLGNAFKFSAKAESPAVSVGVEPAAEGPVFFVKDNGAGFDMHYADKLFGVFQRLHQASEFPGTGVGLVIVKRIVERHGGCVWAKSVPGAGATFRFTLGQKTGSESNFLPEIRL